MGIPVVILADVQVNYGIFSAYVQWFSHGESRAEDSDVIRWCHSDCSCYLGKGSIRRASLSFGAVIWVSGTEWFSLLLSHWPSTPAISVPLVEQDYIQDELSTLFIHVHAPRLFVNILVSTILFVSQLAG